MHSPRHHPATPPMIGAGHRARTARRADIRTGGALIAFLLLIATWLNSPAPSHSAGKDKSKAAAAKHALATDSARKPPTPLPEPDMSVPLARQYCETMRDNLAEARFSSQTAQLRKLAGEVDTRAKQLEERSAELKQWIAKRDAIVQQASSQLVGIYAAMRPEAASEQLVRLNVETASAILLRLDQRAASAILNDMPSDKAARITSTIAELSRTKERGPLR